MMKQTKWLISFSACLIALAISSGGAKNRLNSAFEPERQNCLPHIQTLPLPPLSYGIGADRDSISYPSELKEFFEGLEALQAGQDTILTVVQLGDSHIQAGYYPGKVMRLLQEQFGNAGRGWIAPFKLSKTNEPDDYFITSAAKEWVTGRAIQNVKKSPIGIGGIGIRSASPSINLDVTIAPSNGNGYSFNQAVLYRGDKSMLMLPAGRLKDSVSTFLSKESVVPGVVADTFRLSRLTDTLQFHSTRRKQGTDQLLPASHFDNIYYGFNLTNGNSGILYHAIGVNGAMYVNYTDEEYVRQLALLKPSLLIISLGTNETFGRRFTSEEFSAQVETFISLVKKRIPETAILLTTPPECYKRAYVNKKRTYVRNSNTQIAARVIKDVARREGIACWDLFAATGGKNSCTKWQKAHLMGRDRVHFTKEGYREQGALFYRALIQSYNQYIEKKDVR